MTASVAPLTSTAAGALLPDWEAVADVVVVGTGVAGLTAALTTASAGLSVLLILLVILGIWTGVIKPHGLGH